jgi:hypothetical protein
VPDTKGIRITVAALFSFVIEKARKTTRACPVDVRASLKGSLQTALERNFQDVKFENIHSCMVKWIHKVRTQIEETLVMKMSEYHTLNHCKFLIQYHIIWCPKFRYKFEIKELEIMPDHIHMFVSTEPTVRNSCGSYI